MTDRLEVVQDGLSAPRLAAVVGRVRATLPEFGPETWERVGDNDGLPLSLYVSEWGGVWSRLFHQDGFDDLGQIFRALLWEPARAKGYERLHSAKLKLCDQHEPGYPGLDARIEFYWAQPTSVLDAMLEG